MSLTHAAMCSAEDFIDTPAKKWTESPESDAVLLKRDDRTGTNAVDDDSVQVKVMSPKEVRVLKRSCSSSAAAVLGREQKQLTVASRETCGI